MPRIYDLSPAVHAGLAVFPGDTAYERRVTLDFPRGDHFQLSEIRTTLHLGAHVDAPSHYHAEGAPIDARPLERYFGDAQVLTVSTPAGGRVRPEHLPRESLRARRLLLRTNSFPDPDRWTGGFSSLSPDLVDWAAARGVVLLGIDTPSIDPAEDQALLAHRAVFARDLAVLEGITLQGVPDGVYFLMALPLRLVGADASPVRAILVEGELRG